MWKDLIQLEQRFFGLSKKKKKKVMLSFTVY